MSKKTGLTLVEILIASVILTVALGGILTFTAQYLKGLDSTRNFSIAINAAQERMERIKAQTSTTSDSQKLGSFDQLTLYNNLPFNVYAEDGTTVLTNFKGISYVTTAMTSPVTMYRVKVVVWWKENDGRIMGEDKDFDGTLDTGEDTWTGPGTKNGEIDGTVFLQSNLMNMQ